MLILRRIDAKRKRSQIACILSLILFYLSRQLDEGKKRHKKNVKRKTNRETWISWIRRSGSSRANVPVEIVIRFTIVSGRLNHFNVTRWTRLGDITSSPPSTSFSTFGLQQPKQMFFRVSNREHEKFSLWTANNRSGYRNLFVFYFSSRLDFLMSLGASFFAPSDGSWRCDEPCVALCNGTEWNEIKWNVFTHDQGFDD